MPTSHDEYGVEILKALEANSSVSQRSLAKELGIALGLTNLLIRALVKRGLIRVAGIRPNRVKYLLTPAGIAEKAVMSQAAFRHSVERYRVARRRVREAFEQVSRDWPGAPPHKPIMFLGTGEAAEIGYVCLYQTDLRLVGVFDDQGRSEFFGVPVHRMEDLSLRLLQASGPSRLVVMSLRRSEELRIDLARAEIPAEMITWL